MKFSLHHNHGMIYWCFHLFFACGVDAGHNDRGESVMSDSEAHHPGEGLPCLLCSSTHPLPADFPDDWYIFYPEHPYLITGYEEQADSGNASLKHKCN